MSDRTLTLYLAPGSSSLFPHILLYYCDIPFTPHIVRFSDPSDLIKVNDKQQVPTLVVDGQTITENPAIAHFINQIAPERLLFGHGILEFTKVCEWLNWISASLHAQAWSPYKRPGRFTRDTSAEAQAAIKESAEDQVLKRFKMLEAKLDVSGPWALGEHLTAVDVYIVPFFRFGRDALGVDMAASYPKWSKIVGKVLGMDVAKRALNDEQGVPPKT